MRSRNLKPGFFTNPELLELTPLTRLLFAGLWCMADREGRIEDRPAKIKIALLPVDNCDVDAMLNELQDGGMVRRYEAGGVRVIEVASFLKHQNPHQNEAPSSLPGPSGPPKITPEVPELHQSTPVQAPEQHHATPASSLIPESLIPDSGFLNPDSLVAALSPRRAIPLPKGFAPSVGMLEWARGKALTVEEVEFQTEKFCEHARSNARRQKDWEAAWRAWMLQHLEWNPRPVQTNGPGASKWDGPLTQRIIRRQVGARS